MTRRVPLLPTLVVVAAVALMIGLGLWQLQRAKWKDGIVKQYAAAEKLPPIAWPTVQPPEASLPLFRYATGVCLRRIGVRTAPGENRSGEPGYLHIVDCAPGPNGSGMSVEVGWSKNPNAAVNWNGGPVSGIIAPDRRNRMRLVAASPAPGLEASAAPSLSSIRNNHRSYALQWFSFALIASVIYALALMRRGKRAPTP